MSQRPRRSFSADAEQQELDRVIPRVTRLGRQLQALDLALAPYTTDGAIFESELWARAFASNEPREIAEVAAVTGIFESLVNHSMELLQSGGRLAGLDISEGPRPSGPQLVSAVVADGGFSRAQGDALVRLYRTRNDLQHSSPEVEADRVHADIELLRGWLKGFVRSYVDWLRAHGTDLFPAKS